MFKSTLKIIPQASSMLAVSQIIHRCPRLVSPLVIQINKYSSALDITTGHLSKSSTRHSSSVATQEKEPVLHQEQSVSDNKEPIPDKLYAKIVCELRANDPEVMRSYSTFAVSAAKHLNIEVGECYAQKKAHHERYTLLRSVHVVKRCRVQYEVRTYFRWMNFHKLTGSTADTFLEYIQRNLPEGVAMKVTKYEIQELPSHLVPPAALDAISSETPAVEEK